LTSVDVVGRPRELEGEGQGGYWTRRRSVFEQLTVGISNTISVRFWQRFINNGD
jgi:hypothetical protein